MVGSWTLTVFVADDGTVPYGRFRDRLDPLQRDALDTAAQVVLAGRGIELARSEWLKALGDGLHEFRIRHSAAETARMFGAADVDGMGSARVLLRVFVHFHGRQVVLLLGGYDKGADPGSRRQQREIATARKLLGQFHERQRRERRHARRPH